MIDRVELWLVVWTCAALRSRGDDYRGYRRETSPFAPWFPRSSTAP